MNNKKSILCLILSICLLIPAMFLLSGCGRIDATLSVTEGFTLSKLYDGEPVVLPDVDDYITDSEGAISFEWYSGTTKLSSAPLNAGNYTLKIIAAKTKTHKAASVEVNFTIYESVKYESNYAGIHSTFLTGNNTFVANININDGHYQTTETYAGTISLENKYNVGTLTEYTRTRKAFDLVVESTNEYSLDNKIQVIALEKAIEFEDIILIKENTSTTINEILGYYADYDHKISCDYDYFMEQGSTIGDLEDLLYNNEIVVFGNCTTDYFISDSADEFTGATYMVGSSEFSTETCGLFNVNATFGDSRTATYKIKVGTSAENPNRYVVLQNNVSDTHYYSDNTVYIAKGTTLESWISDFEIGVGTGVSEDFTYVPVTANMISGTYNENELGEYVITFTNSGQSASIKFIVYDAEVESTTKTMWISSDYLTVEKGNDKSFEVILSKTDGTVQQLVCSTATSMYGITVTNFDKNTAGPQLITLTKDNVSIQIVIYVYDSTHNPVVRIEVDKIEYNSSGIVSYPNYKTISMDESESEGIALTAADFPGVDQNYQYIGCRMVFIQKVIDGKTFYIAVEFSIAYT